jgi:hypothetical protein
LSNLVCTRLDRRLAGLAGARGVLYTRYADDLTFSAMTPSKLAWMTRYVTGILRDEGFEVNHRKTRFMGPRRCRRVTGLVVRDEGFGIAHDTKRLLRAKLHRLFAAGLPGLERARLAAHLRGWAAFLRDVDPAAKSQLERYERRLRDRFGGVGCFG